MILLEIIDQPLKNQVHHIFFQFACNLQNLLSYIFLNQWLNQNIFLLNMYFIPYLSRLKDLDICRTFGWNGIHPGGTLSVSVHPKNWRVPDTFRYVCTIIFILHYLFHNLLFIFLQCLPFLSVYVSVVFKLDTRDCFVATMWLIVMDRSMHYRSLDLLDFTLDLFAWFLCLHCLQWLGTEYTLTNTAIAQYIISSNMTGTCIAWNKTII